MKKSAAVEKLQSDAMVDAYLALQQELEASGEIPIAAPDVVDRLHGVLVALGAIQIGFVIASFAVFVNFVVVNLFFHL